MKYLIILLFSIPTTIFAQEGNSAIGLSGGGEHYAPSHHAWNIELSYHDRIVNSKRFWTEFGINYSVSEYKGDSQDRIDTTVDYSNQLAIGYTGYFVIRENPHYTRNSFLRFQAGVNFTIIDGEKFNVSTGLNLTTQLSLSTKEHGQRVYFPINDTLSISDIHYQYEVSTKELTLFVQPHIDARYLLIDNLWITSRIGYYDAFFERLYPIPSSWQANVGVRYYL